MVVYSQQHRRKVAVWSMRDFLAWLTCLLLAGIEGAVLTFMTIPGDNDMWESPLLMPTLGILTMLCGLAWLVSFVRTLN